MSKDDIWYGYLAADKKSSPVVRDLSLETGNRKTVYLYNHARDSFLEYAREIVEPKLRELSTDDIPLDQLKSAFDAARKSFLAGRSVKSWEKVKSPESSSAPAKSNSADEDLDMDSEEDYEEYEMEV